MNKCDWCGADTGEVLPLKPPEVYERTRQGLREVQGETRKRH